MFRRKLKFFGAALALTGLLALNLHVLAHVLGHDDDHGQGAKAPCALCQTVLAQHSLPAAPSVEVPSVVGTFFFIQALGPSGFDRPIVVDSDPRGPPMDSLI